MKMKYKLEMYQTTWPSVSRVDMPAAVVFHTTSSVFAKRCFFALFHREVERWLVATVSVAVTGDVLVQRMSEVEQS